jgi:DNA-binding NarL/FixJ family response regulator
LITKVLIVDDHPVVIWGCKSLFAMDSSVEIAGSGDAKAGYQAFLQNRPDVTVIDIKLPDVSGFELMRQVRAKDPEAKIIMFSPSNDLVIAAQAIQLGADGFLSKSDDLSFIVQAVKHVAAGQNYISPHLAQLLAFSSAARTRRTSSQRASCKS